jgi:hypothetical protein
MLLDKAGPVGMVQAVVAATAEVRRTARDRNILADTRRIDLLKLE